MTTRRDFRPHLSHWGAFDAQVENGTLVAVRPFEHDPNPAGILGNFVDSVRHQTRITQPMVRKGWLENGPGPSDKRGAEPFVPVSWEQVIPLLGDELARVYRDYPAESVFGGSYGWASAGRFHHAQSQMHRFLNTLGGYTKSINSYSYGAGAVILPHVLASTDELHYTGTHWPTLVEHTEMFVAFGGMPLKNTQVSSGGLFRHRTPDFQAAARERGAEFLLFSPIRDDLADSVEAEWYPVSPGSDVALMLAMAYTLITGNHHDREFLDRYCVGFDRLEQYILGTSDGQPKTPEWAEPLCQIPAETIAAVARRMVGKRVFITTTWSLQRNEYGEQPPWMAVALAAILGQIGLPGGGFGFGYGSSNRSGEAKVPDAIGLPAFSQLRNPVKAFIPVARIADMLLNPGKEFDYNGRKFTYPDIRLIYWCGGNPFHHHQQLPRFRRALSGIDTFVVQDPFWTATARHADIVIPSTMTLERNDIGGSHNDAYLAAMHKAVEPHADSRTDYETFSLLARHLGVEEQFTEGRDEMQWLRYIYETWRENAAGAGYHFPDFDAFWNEGYIQLPVEEHHVLFAGFRNDPEKHRLSTPSGKVELFSERIDSFGYDDCAGHPTWYQPREFLGSDRAGRFPLMMIANNPKTRLHSQLDVGGYSQASKIQGREPLRIHPLDAEARGISDGDVVRVFNDRGSFLAGVIISEDVRPDVVQVSTGAWYDPLDPSDPDSMCVHGNPNALTLDKPSSKLAGGSVGQHALVEIERWQGELPPIKVLGPPPTA